MSMEIVPLGEFNGTEIQVRPSDQYIDVTAMCKANGKSWSEYMRLPGTKRFINALESSLGKSQGRLVEQVANGANGERHTFAHRRIALHCAAWNSAEFEQWVYAKIEELMTRGSVSIRQYDPLLPNREAIKQIVLEVVNTLRPPEPMRDFLTMEDRLRERHIQFSPKQRKRATEIAVALHEQHEGVWPTKQTAQLNGRYQFERKHLWIVDAAIDRVLDSLKVPDMRLWTYDD